MTKSNKNWLIVVIGITAIVILWILFRNNPKVAQVTQVIKDAIPFDLPSIRFPSVVPINVDIDVEGYTPHDYPLPGLPNYGSSDGNKGTSCNFCLQSRVQISPPSPPVKVAPINAPMPQPVRSFSVGARSTPASGVPHYSATGIYLGRW